MKGTFHLKSLELLIKNISETFDAYTVALFLARGGEPLELFYSWSISDDIKKEATILKGEGPIGWVFREDRPINITRFREGKGFTGIYKKRPGIKALLAVPLPRGQGVLMVDSKTKLGFSKKQEKILLNFARTISSILSLESGLSLLPILKEIIRWQSLKFDAYEDNLLSFMSIFSFEHCFISRHIPDRPFFIVKGVISRDENEYLRALRDRRFDVGAGIAGWIFKDKGDFLKVQGEKGPRGFLFERNEDIASKDNILGLFYPPKENAISVEHVLLFSGPTVTYSFPRDLILEIKKGLSRGAPWE